MQNIMSEAGFACNISKFLMNSERGIGYHLRWNSESFQNKMKPTGCVVRRLFVFLTTLDKLPQSNYNQSDLMVTFAVEIRG